jgi:hypothetical protein
MISDEEIYHIMENCAAQIGFTNEFSFSEAGKFDAKCWTKLTKEELIVKTESFIYNIDSSKLDLLIE